MDIERLKRRKQKYGYTNAYVARETGVPLGTVQKVFGNTTRNPRRETYVKLARLLAPELLEIPGQSVEQHRYDWRREDRDSRAGIVREEALEYGAANRKIQGECTLNDYYDWPEDQRIELIDGVIYDLASPSYVHQIITGEIHAQLLRCMEEHDVPCLPGVAPIDVQLDKDEKTMVQPDGIIVFDPSLVEGRVVRGAPEFILEVLSPSTQEMDLTLKLYKYHRAGCQEYWIIDPENERVIVYFFEDPVWPKIYSFRDHVPVGVSRGFCAIDFPKIRAKVERWDLEGHPDRIEERRAEYEAWMRRDGSTPAQKGEGAGK